MNKIIYLNNLPDIISNSNVVLCHGVFDLVHLGHIQHLQEAKKYGDVLIVSVTEDKFVNKGPGRPVFNTQQRAEFLTSLTVVDYVTISQEASAVSVIEAIKPKFYVRGTEYYNRTSNITNKLSKEKEAVEKHGGKLIFISGSDTFSSTKLLNNITYNKKSVEYLEAFRQKYTTNDIWLYLDKIQQLNVNLLGEIIFDEYIYVNPLGKSSKYPSMAVSVHDTKTYRGGILAVAKLMSNFVNHIHLISYVDGCRWIDHLASNITTSFFIKPNSPLVTKQRYIERYYQQRLFEVYNYNPKPCNTQTVINNIVYWNLPIFIIDYGHGLINNETATSLCNRAKYLAVNVQCNAGNYGFNLARKYPNTNFITIDENELKLNANNQYLDLKELLSQINSIFTCVTLGNRGSMSVMHDQYSKNMQTKYYDQCPAFATKIVDTVGAGDAFFVLSSLFHYVKAPSDIINFIGNVAGALAVESIGHETVITKEQLQKAVVALLK